MNGHPNRAASGNSDETLSWRPWHLPMSVPGSETAADLATIAVRLDETDAAAITASGRSFPLGATVLAEASTSRVLEAGEPGGTPAVR